MEDPRLNLGNFLLFNIFRGIFFIHSAEGETLRIFLLIKNFAGFFYNFLQKVYTPSNATNL